MPTLTQRILDSDWKNLKDDCETVLSKKIIDRIEIKKQEFIDKIRGIDVGTNKED